MQKRTTIIGASLLFATPLISCVEAIEGEPCNPSEDTIECSDENDDLLTCDDETHEWKRVQRCECDDDGGTSCISVGYSGITSAQRSQDYTSSVRSLRRSKYV